MAGQGGPRDFEGIIRFSGGSEGIGRNRQSIRGGGLWNIECQRGANIRISQSLRRDQVNCDTDTASISYPSREINNDLPLTLGAKGGRTDRRKDRQTTLHKEPKQRNTQPGTLLRNSSLGI